MVDEKAEISAAAARWVVEEGLDFGEAKRCAAQALGLAGKSGWPDNAQIETSVREYLALYCADTHPGELLTLRQLALDWMERLTQFRPYLAGPVWRGTANHLSDICIHLFCMDCKMVELMLIDQQIAYQSGSVSGPRGEPASVLSLWVNCQALATRVGVHLQVHPYDEMRTVLKSDARGMPLWGSLTAMQRLMAVVP